MNKLFEKNRKLMPLSAIVLVVLFIAIEILLTAVSPYLSISQVVITTMIKIVLSIVCIFITTKIYGVKIGFGKKKLVKGIFWLGLLMCIGIIINLVGSYENPEIGFIQALPILLLIFIFYMSIGLYEEILCRGFLFGTFRKYFGEGKKEIYLSVLLSSLVFGCAHLSNLTVNPELVMTTIAQVVYAFFIGVLLAVIYYRTENLLPCIILHGIFDFAGSFWLCFSKDIEKKLNMSAPDINIVTATITIVSCSLYLIAGLLQLRKVFENKSNNN